MEFIVSKATVTHKNFNSPYPYLVRLLMYGTVCKQNMMLSPHMLAKIIILPNFKVGMAHERSWPIAIFHIEVDAIVLLGSALYY